MILHWNFFICRHPKGIVWPRRSRRRTRRDVLAVTAVSSVSLAQLTVESEQTAINISLGYHRNHSYYARAPLVFMSYTSHPRWRTWYNREYFGATNSHMNNRFHSEAKLPWSYDYPLANHIGTNKSSANREMPLLSRLYTSFGHLRKIFPPRGLKYSLFSISAPKKPGYISRILFDYTCGVCAGNTCGSLQCQR